jgi:hypothetical protein
MELEVHSGWVIELFGQLRTVRCEVELTRFARRSPARSSAALQKYREIEEILRDELGVDPIPAATRLADEIRSRSDAAPNPTITIQAGRFLRPGHPSVKEASGLNIPSASRGILLPAILPP